LRQNDDKSAMNVMYFVLESLARQGASLVVLCVLVKKERAMTFLSGSKMKAFVSLSLPARENSNHPRNVMLHNDFHSLTFLAQRMSETGTRGARYYCTPHPSAFNCPCRQV
jgi:hypothetical protein